MLAYNYSKISFFPLVKEKVYATKLQLNISEQLKMFFNDQ